MPCSSQIMSETLPEVHTMQKSDFPKPIILSQIIQFSVKCGKLSCHQIITM